MTPRIYLAARSGAREWDRIKPSGTQTELVVGFRPGVGHLFKAGYSWISGTPPASGSANVLALQYVLSVKGLPH